MGLLVARDTCETGVPGDRRMPRGLGNETMNRVGKLYSSVHFYSDAFTIFRVVKSTQYTEGLAWHRKKYGRWSHDVVVVSCEDEVFLGWSGSLTESFLWSWQSRRSAVEGICHADTNDPPEPFSRDWPEGDFSRLPTLYSTFEKYNTEI